MAAWPRFVNARGVPPEQVGLVLAAGTAIRLLAAPLAGRIAYRLQALRAVLVVCIACAAAATLAYVPAHGSPPSSSSRCCMRHFSRR